MVFSSWTFAGLMVVFLPLYFILRTHLFWRNILLIATSYFFYGWWDWRFLILVAVSTSVDYIAAIGASGQIVTARDIAKSAYLLILTTIFSIAASGTMDFFLAGMVGGGVVLLVLVANAIRALPQASVARRSWLLLSLVTNLGILGFFKYFNFFADSLAALLKLAGVAADHPTLAIILPVGLSFYTFQAISRTIDSYRGEFVPKRSIIDYAAYHAFFPQLVAGPIERASHLMPQFETILPITWAMLRSGAMLFLWGLFQKVVVADNLAPLSDAVFNAPQGQTGAATLVGILAFSFQIYGDFCGYSNMARGLARCLGFDLMRNFELPYFSRSPQEFWRRWHISLSRWLRDYLYIPLGGSHHGEAATYRNLMATMLLGGLWHGAAWTFVAWGGFHGALQVVSRAISLDRFLAARKPDSIGNVAVHVAAWFATSIMIGIGWVFFRARSFADAATILGNCLSPTGYSFHAFATLLYYIAPLIVVEIWQRFQPGLPMLFREPPFLARYSAAVCLVLGMMLLSAEGGRQFIYFDF